MPEDRPNWALIVHGGAKEIAPGDEGANRDGLRQAAEAGRRVLVNGGWGFAASSDVTAKEVRRVTEEAIAIARVTALTPVLAMTTEPTVAESSR